MLANDAGRWTGKGWGALFHTFFDVSEYTARHPAGTRTVKVIHGMADKLLMGVNDVGIRIEK
jgi:gliding motility-associated lipoprotein GldH